MKIFSLHRSVIVTLIAVSLALGMWAWTEQKKIDLYNTRLEQKNFVALESETVNGRFVRAWRQQNAGELEKARTGYNEILHVVPEELSQTVQFNLANIYLRQAIDGLSDSSEDNDTTVLPLVELAKHIYRKLLLQSPDLWPAKHNLEITLRLAPDEEIEAVPEDILPERSPESQGVIEEYKKLP